MRQTAITLLALLLLYGTSGQILFLTLAVATALAGLFAAVVQGFSRRF